LPILLLGSTGIGISSTIFSIVYIPDYNE